MEILKWKCPECDKVIESIYKLQFKHNKKQHIESHKRNKSPNACGGDHN